MASATLTDADEALITLVALAGPLNITRWSELAAGADLRESAARAFSTMTLRQRASTHVRLGLVVEREGQYRCAPPMRTLVLRSAATRPGFERFVGVAFRRTGFGSTPKRSELTDGALVDIHRKAKGALESLARLEAEHRDGAEDLAIEMLAAPFDDGWYLGLEPPLRSRLVELALVGAESRSPFFDGLYRFLAEDVRRLSDATPATISAFAGLAILRGELAPVAALADAAFAWLQQDRLLLPRPSSKSEKNGLSWLADQYRHAASVLYNELPPEERILAEKPDPAPKSLATNPSLFAARKTRPQRQVALEKLAAIVKNDGAIVGPVPATQEQIVWRVFPSSGYIEPHIQKRSAGKWTGGRKLAVKHLLGATETTAALPPEDRRVASWAREERYISGGYPIVNHSFDRRAWLALIGHPRVLFEATPRPLQVLAGTAKVVARSRGDSLVASIEPPNLKDGINLRRAENTIVVYDVDAHLSAVLGAIGAGIEVPAQAKGRLLAMLEGIAHVVPVESTEQTAAARVEPDSRPCFRLIPSRGGLSIALLVRPLGGGPLVEPGTGAPTLLGQAGGRSVQTERDLDLETRRAQTAIDACTALSAGQQGLHSWFLDDPVSCLEVVSSLQALEPGVSVEWPHGAPLRVRSRVGRSAIRGRVTLDAGWLEVDARLTIDDSLSVEMAQILELLAKHPGRFIQLAADEYVELEQDLRDVLDRIAAARSTARATSGPVALPPSAIVVLEQLSAGESELSLTAAQQQCSLD